MSPTDPHAPEPPVASWPGLGPVMAAVDLGAEDSQRVVREAAALARSLRRPLHLIHVLEPLPEEALILPIIPDIQEKRRQQAMTRLHSFKKAHAPEAVVLLNEGPAWQEIIRMAAEHAVTLVITGCGAEGGVLAKLIGSTAERVVRHAPCPVLVLRGDEGQMLAGGGPLLLCTDRSEASCAAFYHAVAFSTLLAAPLLLACVEEPLALPGTLEYQRFHPEIDAEREAADTALDCFRAAHLPSSMDVRPCVVEGTPHRALCRLAAREQARMVIAARHGLHGWRKALIGSTTERLVRHAPCAVLVVPARCAAHDADGASLA